GTSVRARRLFKGGARARNRLRFEVLGFSGSRVLRFWGSGVLGFSGSRVPGVLGFLCVFSSEPRGQSFGEIPGRPALASIVWLRNFLSRRTGSAAHNGTSH